MSSSTPSIILHDLVFDWPDGTPVLPGVSGTFGTGRTSLVGDNGAGKSTLLKLIAGTLRPTAGRVIVSDTVGYLPQTITLDADATIARLLGVDATIAALRAIESGDVDERHFDVVGDDWDIEARAAEALRDSGFVGADLDRTVAELSGGETMLIGILGMRVRRTPITLLDEPTNNLDRATRARVAGLIDSWPGALVLVSHDRDLLELVDDTAELHSGALTVFGGPYSAWREHVEREQDAAVQAARSAEQALKVEKRQRAEAESKLAQRARTGKATQRSGSIPRILAGARANSAQVSAGSMRTTMDAKVQSAQAAADATAARIRSDEHIHLTLPDPDVPTGKRIAELRGTNRTIIVQGPERVALTGPNGVGKTTLLEHLVEGRESSAGHASGTLHVHRVGYLSQRLDGLDDTRSALDNVSAAAPTATPGEIRNQLARLLVRGASADRPVATLSGGERFRVALARLLLADPPAQLLILDEPTNNLDLRSIEQLVEALAVYRGALLVVSHDDSFVERAQFDVVLELDAEGALHERRG